MQNTKNLNKKYVNILEEAKKIIKKSYKKDISSMASILLSKKGFFYTGVNVKYKNIWKCICGERVAIAKALENNDLKFDTIATVKYYPKNNLYSVINMCGECLQIAINHKGLKVIVDNKGILQLISIEKILPYAYL